LVQAQVGPPTKKERKLNQDKPFEYSRGFSLQLSLTLS